jgi:hypothetical protein
MIPRLKRRTKKRHSVKPQRFVTARYSWDRSLEREIRARGTFTIDIQPITEPIIGARLSPDVWAT